MRHDIGYNSQRDNLDFSGKFKGWNQCFTTSAWMLMSFYSEKINAADDKGLSEYLDDVENTVGSAGIGEKVKAKFKWITGSTSYWWLVQKEGIEKWLWERGIKGQAIYKEKMPFYELYNILDDGPVILQTKGMGGTKGHIILAVGYEGRNIICHDPFGDAIGDYEEKTGMSVNYPEKWLKKYTGENIMCLYWSV